MKVIYTQTASRQIESQIAYLISRDAHAAAVRARRRIESFITDFLIHHPPRWEAYSRQGNLRILDPAHPLCLDVSHRAEKCAFLRSTIRLRIAQVSILTPQAETRLPQPAAYSSSQTLSGIGRPIQVSAGIGRSGAMRNLSCSTHMSWRECWPACQVVRSRNSWRLTSP
jgi:hypothetical protein